MKYLLVFILPLLCSSASEWEDRDSFYQDIAVIHSFKNGLPKGKISTIEILERSPVAFTMNEAYRWNGSRWAKATIKKQAKQSVAEYLPEDAGKVHSVIPYGKGFAIGCETGLYISNTGIKDWEKVLPGDDNYSWAPRKVTTLIVDTKDRLWFGSEQGVGYKDGDRWKLFTGKDGLPYNQFTCSAKGPDGIVWFGTEKGAIRAEDDAFYYRFSKRWLPDDQVNSIAVGPDGTAWIATENGVSQIISKVMTFEAKADHFIRQVEERHNRMGFVCQSHLSEQFDINSSQLAISDNDGLYTAMYGAAHAYRYAVTGDPEARELAKRSFYACKWLVDITHEPGFPARVIIPIDWHEPVNEQYSREYNKRKQKTDPFWKDIYPRFPKSKDGKYRWKCDTSSDELAGHYFFYGIYYDLIAETEEEKKDVRKVVTDITDHLIRNGFLLRDHDGKPTRWANFQPEFFNSVWGWEQRGLNSMMLLSFLNVAKHVTGDLKYEKTAQLLREKHQYHINAMHPKEFFPPDNVVPWDNNLCLMSMYGLINYEKDPELLLMYRYALENAWLHISKQKNAFWDGLYGALADRFTALVDEGYFDSPDIFPENPLYASGIVHRFYNTSLQKMHVKVSLERIPMDLIGYRMDNTHRLDVLFDPTPAQEPTIGWGTDGYALPVDERGHVRLDRDGYALDYSEGNGYSEHEGTFYLLPYYLAKYHKLLE